MSIGPLEYVVIGFQDNQFTNEVLPVLGAVQEKGAIRVVDLLFVSKDADGTVTMREVSELSEEELAAYVGVHLNWNPLALVGVLVFVLLGAACFSTFSLIIACLVKTRERFMGIGQVLTMPLFFASNAIYPTAMMPTWLQVIAQGNPLTYEVEGLRALMLGSAVSLPMLGLDFLVLFVATTGLVAIGGWLYPKVVI